MSNLVFILELIGTVAFSLSGTLTGIQKKMDLLGVMILGAVTATGGGILRDIFLGVLPPKAFINGIYILVSSIVSVTVFFYIYFRFKGYRKVIHADFLPISLIADAIGLGIFTVVGVKAVFDADMAFNCFIPILLGTITGVGGGVFRDVLVGDKPYIFVRHIYACAAIVGALISTALWIPCGQSIAAIAGFFSVLIIRIIAIKYNLNLPKVDLPEET
ncbi:MAG: TRIC cation channel family protein [Spirochaetaceae bacterium]|nr:TRIC cation channel family protein [Spirochaetaceae bacterium]